MFYLLPKGRARFGEFQMHCPNSSSYSDYYIFFTRGRVPFGEFQIHVFSNHSTWFCIYSQRGGCILGQMCSHNNHHSLMYSHRRVPFGEINIHGWSDYFTHSNKSTYSHSNHSQMGCVLWNSRSMFASYSTYHNCITCSNYYNSSQRDGLLLENSRSIFVITVLNSAYDSPQNYNYSHLSTYCERGGCLWRNSRFMCVLIIWTNLSILLLSKGGVPFDEFQIHVF